jgi:hypothetical protein
MNAGGGGGGGAAAASSSAASSSSGSGYGVWPWLLLFFSPVLLSCCVLPFACTGTRPDPNATPTPNGGAGKMVAAMGTLQIQFAREQARFDGLEVFIDGKVVKQSVNPYEKRLALQLPAGSHAVSVSIAGKEVFPARNVQVKPSDKGVTTLDIPLLPDPREQGTLVIEIKSLDGSAAGNLELFIDGVLKHTYIHGFELDGQTLFLSPGPHTVALKKNGIEVYSSKVLVKRQTEGKTFLKIDLLVTATVEVRSPQPVGPGVEAYVNVDGANAKRWPVGATTIQIKAVVGRRVVKVYMKQPVDRVIETFNVDVEPGKEVVLKMKE